MCTQVGRRDIVGEGYEDWRRDESPSRGTESDLLGVFEKLPTVQTLGAGQGPPNGHDPVQICDFREPGVEGQCQSDGDQSPAVASVSFRRCPRSFNSEEEEREEGNRVHGRVLEPGEGPVEGERATANRAYPS